MDQESLRDLFSRKQALLLEMKHYESNTKFNEQYERNREVPETSNSMGVIPANTRLQIGLATNSGNSDKKVGIDSYFVNLFEFELSNYLIFIDKRHT